MDYSPPGSSLHGILQARILEWIPTSSSRGSTQPMVKPRSPTLQAYSLPSESPGKPLHYWKPKLYFLKSHGLLSPQPPELLWAGHHRSSGSSSCIPFPEPILFSFTWSVIHFCISITSSLVSTPIVLTSNQFFLLWSSSVRSLTHYFIFTCSPAPSFIQHVLIDWLLDRRHSATTWWSKK